MEEEEKREERNRKEEENEGVRGEGEGGEEIMVKGHVFIPFYFILRPKTY